MKRWITRSLLLLLALLLCTLSAAAMRTHGSVQNQRYDGYTIRQGVDVSEHNGEIDWRAVAASGQADFAFIRVGYRGYSSGGLYPDSRYKENLSGALEAGLEVGVYIYSQATTVAEAREEAYYALDLIGKYDNRVTLPIVIDFEYAESGGYVGRLYEAKLTPAEATDICNAFCEVIEAAGFEACVYANSVMLSEKLHAEGLNGEIWLANYVDETSYTGDYTYWQYTSNGGVAGFKGVVDRNYWYVSPPDHRAQRAESIELEDWNLHLDAGESWQLEAWLEPRDCVDTLRFYSEDPTIAYVDKLSGEITAFRAGTTSIYMETANGLWTECVVTVSGEREQGISAVTLADVPATIFTGVGTQTVLTVCSDQLTGATAQVSSDLLNLRARPNTDFAPVATMEKGERVTILDSAKIDGVSWLAVDWKGQRGFVSADYLTEITGAVALVEGVDYIATYSGNDAPGTAVVTVQGIGRYTGTDSASFRIYSFDDVRAEDWYYDAVLHAVRRGTMNGTSDTQFSPNTATNRAMMATVLHRMDGAPAAKSAGFIDVKTGDWYASAVNWAAETGVDPGVGGKRFDPTGMLTRAVMATMLYRYTQYLGYATPVDGSLGAQFADWAQTPESAKDALCWALGVGLMQGMGNGELAPSGGATRAQMCTVLQRYEVLLAQLHQETATDLPLLAGD